MNYKVVINFLAKIMLLCAVALLLPMIIGFIYGENNFLAFLYPIIGLLAVSIPIILLVKPKDKRIYTKEGLVIVAFSWLLMSLVGAVPFVVTGEIPNYIDAVFETVSGFTTTGSTVVDDVDGLSYAIKFWRSFMVFIGGMGILVFFLAVIPLDSAGSIHIFRAESPGPSASKLVSKMRLTARILYAIYVGLALILFIMLICGGMPVFDAICHSFSTAGTGGFSTKTASIAYYNSTYIEMTIAVFMFIFGINFNFYYLILIGNVAGALRSEEVRAYLIMVLVATFAIAINILSIGYNFGEAMRYSFFQVTTISSTTGLTTTDYTQWPVFSQGILMVLMLVGACGGSTGGGIKVSRLCILIKSGLTSVKKTSNPRAVYTTKFEGQALDDETISKTRNFFFIWILLIVLGVLLVSVADGYGDLITDISAVFSCIGNVGPALGQVGPAFSYAGYSDFATVILSLLMLIGRLEIFPILILFNRKTWKRKINRIKI